jgi:hypothetical protein
MPERAHVTSVEALEGFRASLILYISKARPALEEITSDVLRTRLWLENEQRTYWENQLKRRKREWDEAQAALFSSRLSNLREESSAEVQAVHRCKRAYEEAETKLRILKQWNREFEGRVFPLVKQMEKLQTLLSGDLPRAIAYLGELIRTLDVYAGVAPLASPELSATSGLRTGVADPAEAPATSPPEAPKR